MRRTLSSLALAFALLASSAPPAHAALITPERLLGRIGDQFLPFGNDAYLAFVENTPTKPNRWNATALDRVSHVLTRINEPETFGFPGGFDPGTNDVIYQQAKGRNSAIYRFDLDTFNHTKEPGVNSSAWEWAPRISATYITFLRDVFISGRLKTRVFLYTRGTGDLTKLAAYPGDFPDNFVGNGVVGDRFATWTTCSPKTCAIYVYDAQTTTLRKVPTKNSRPQYAPVVDEAGGYLYFFRSGFGCGLDVILWRVPLAHLGQAPTKISALPDGIDADWTASFIPNLDVGGEDLAFTWIRCTGHSDLYVVPGLIGT
jgi:hypothetical protein